MKRTISMALGLVLASGVLALPASAAPGDLPQRKPTYMSGAMLWVFPKTTYTIGCFDYGSAFFGAPAAMTMLSYTLNDQRGRRVLSNIVVKDGFNSEFITVSGAGGNVVSQTLVPAKNDAPDKDITTYTIKPKVVGLLRVGLASWDGLVACFIGYGGMGFGGVGFTGMSTSKARFLLPSDFNPNGVGVTSSKASVAAMQSYSRSTKGYMFAIFRPGTGVSKVTDPKKKVRHDSSSGKAPPAFSEASSGVWTYSLDADVSQSRSPALWVMELA